MARTPTDTYVDPSIAANSGAGTLGDPYGDLQYALDQVTRDTTNGDRMNVKSGTDEILSSALSLVSYGTPSPTAPLIFQGYSSAQGDGGVGGITGNGTNAMLAVTTHDGVGFVDMHLHNTGSANIVTVDANCFFLRCEIDNSTGQGITAGANCDVVGCYIHNIGGDGANMNGQNSTVMFNYFQNGTNDFGDDACECSNGTVVMRNIFDLDGSSVAIRAAGSAYAYIANNSIYSNGGTGTGILLNSASSHTKILNNLIEGFSGTGGTAIEGNGATLVTTIIGGNSYYNNDTDDNLTNNLIVLDYGGNETLSASPFTDAAGGDFSPVDTGTAKEGSLPNEFGSGLV